MINEAKCAKPNTDQCTPEKGMVWVLDRKLGAPHAQSIVAEKLLYTP
jgi:hypothetical protein